MEIILVVGATPHRLSESDARWLDETIRRACLDDRGQPIATDAPVRACLQLADVLRENLERGLPEPTELGQLQREGLRRYVLDEELVASSPPLSALYDSLLRTR